MLNLDLEDLEQTRLYWNQLTHTGCQYNFATSVQKIFVYKLLKHFKDVLDFELQFSHRIKSTVNRWGIRNLKEIQREIDKEKI